MQMMSPQQGHRFPDNPQQQSGPRFASNMPQAQQGYEPQQRMQSSVPVLQQPTYATGQLQALHGTQPVQTMPRMTTARQAQISPTALQGTPLIVYTMQGQAVAVTDQEMQRVLADMHTAPAQEQQGKLKGRQRGRQTQEGQQEGRQKKEIRGKKEQQGKFVMKFSVVWCIFGVIGIISTALAAYEWVIIPFLVWLHQVTGGAL